MLAQARATPGSLTLRSFLPTPTPAGIIPESLPAGGEQRSVGRRPGLGDAAVKVHELLRLPARDWARFALSIRAWVSLVGKSVENSWLWVCSSCLAGWMRRREGLARESVDRREGAYCLVYAREAVRCG